MASKPYHIGNWLPSDQAVLDSWLKNLIEEVDGLDHVDAPEDDANLHPVVKEFQNAVENDAKLLMFFNQMFKEVPFPTDPTGQPQVKDYRQMFRLINAIMTRAPEFNETGLVGFPINAIRWPPAADVQPIKTISSTSTLSASLTTGAGS